MNQALGLIETVGKVAAVTAMDAAVKAADVTLISLENSRGKGRMCAKLTGEVSAVKAAVEAGCSACREIGGEVYASIVIANPSDQLDGLIEATKGKSYLESWHPKKEEATTEDFIDFEISELLKDEISKDSKPEIVEESKDGTVLSEMEKPEKEEIIVEEEPQNTEAEDSANEESPLQTTILETAENSLENIEIKNNNADSDKKKTTKEKKVNSKEKSSTKNLKTKK